MRILRSTFYAPDLTPMSTVVRDSDVIDTLEGVRESVKTPGYFTVFEIFDVDGDIGIEEATHAAGKRINFDDEKNQAIQFYWACAQFQLASENGHVIMPEPAPLTSDQVRVVFDQIKDHPDYKHQTVVATSREADIITLRDGKVD